MRKLPLTVSVAAIAAVSVSPAASQAQTQTSADTAPAAAAPAPSPQDTLLKDGLPAAQKVVEDEQVFQSAKEISYTALQTQASSLAQTLKNLSDNLTAASLAEAAA